MVKLKFQTISRDAEWDSREKFIDPRLNTSKNYQIKEYVDDFASVYIEVADEDAAAFRNYVGYIEDYTEDE